MPNPKKLQRERPAPLDGPSEHVILGDRTYEMWPQQIGHLRSGLGVALGNIADLELTGGNVINMLGEKVHATLKVFIPDLVSEWEFQGFATKEALEKDDYNPEYDNSPTPGQIKEAFQVASRLNEVDLLKHLGKLIGPDLIRPYIAGLMAESLEARKTTSSQSSLSESSATP